MRDLHMSSPAEAALIEFGGLHVVPTKKSGIECAPSSFNLDPERADEIDEDDLATYRPFVSGELFPLGEMENGHASLFIDDGGQVYMLFDDLEIVGESIEDALDALVVGRLPRKIIPAK